MFKVYNFFSYFNRFSSKYDCNMGLNFFKPFRQTNLEKLIRNKSFFNCKFIYLKNELYGLRFVSFVSVTILVSPDKSIVDI